MGALSHFVLMALMRRMVENGLLSDNDVGAIYEDAASNLIPLPRQSDLTI